MNCNRGLPLDFTLYWILHTFMALYTMHQPVPGTILCFTGCDIFNMCILWTVFLQVFVLTYLMIPVRTSPCMDTVFTRKCVYMLFLFITQSGHLFSHAVYMFTWAGVLVLTFPLWGALYVYSNCL